MITSGKEVWMPDITIGTWRTRDGRKAHVGGEAPLEVEKPQCKFIGWVGGMVYGWNENGHSYQNRDTMGDGGCGSDLIEPWREPVTMGVEVVLVRYELGVEARLSLEGFRFSAPVIARKIVTITEGEGIE
jgi:hypothetical protein